MILDVAAVNIEPEGWPEPQRTDDNRRQHRRVDLAAIAAVSVADGPIAVWIVQNLSQGGAQLVGDPLLIPGQRFGMSLYLPGAPPLALTARALRRQVAAREARCAIVFDALSPQQAGAVASALEAAGSRTRSVTVSDLIVGPRGPVLAALVRELRDMGRTPRLVTSPLEAAAWLQRESSAATLIVAEKLMETRGWNVLKFVRDARPKVKRLVVAGLVHTFRLNMALRSGLADAVIEQPFDAAALAKKLAFDR